MNEKIILTVKFPNYRFELYSETGELYIRDEDDDVVIAVKLEDLLKAIKTFRRLEGVEEQ